MLIFITLTYFVDREYTYQGAYVEMKEQLGESGLFFHHVGPESKHLYQPGHLTDPRKDILKMTFI